MNQLLIVINFVARKRVLILSDSKNQSFDCTAFRDPIAFRSNLYFLRDLEGHSEAIKQSDIVLISAGINDIRRNKVNPRTLHDHVRRVTSMYPKTQFLFDAVSPLALRADRFSVLNDSVDKLNELMMHLSVRQGNFKLFENTTFSAAAYLAHDGLHLNRRGQDAMSKSWVNAVLVRLGMRRGTLPIRPKFQAIHREYEQSRANRFVT